MATTRVQLPDGNIGEFPASMKPEEIESVLAKQFPPESAAPPVPHAPEPAGIRGGQGPGLTGIDPHAMPHSMADVGKEGLTALSNIGGGGLGALATMGRLTAIPDLLMGKPTIYQDAYHAMSHPVDTAKGVASGIMEHPLETIEQGIGAAGAMGMVPEGVNLVDKLPSKARAGSVLQDIRTQAANVPVDLTSTTPEVMRFKDLVKAGGKPERSVMALYKRANPPSPRMSPVQAMQSDLSGTTPPPPKPVMFPEARDMYSNVSDASHASTLSKLMGTAPKPTMLRQIGSVRNAFNDDLTNAAAKIGRGEDYTNAMTEYARAAKLRSALIKGGGMAAGAALGHSLPGKILSKFVPTH